MKKINLYDLNIGDKFVEESENGSCAYYQVINKQNGSIIALDLLRKNEVSLETWADASGYAPSIFRLVRGEDPIDIFGSECF